MTDKMPPPLILLASVYGLLAATGLFLQQAIIASLLLALLAVAIIGRQKSAWLLMMIMAVLLSLSGLALALLLNMSSETSPDWLTALQSWSLGQQFGLICALMLLGGIQGLVTMMPNVRLWFKPKMNFNIIQ
ncbi:hypothetical protein FJQ87_05880 [Shewanella sp. SNU WT4]|uniref:hypothetical protein n=1 Tax=Shewanella sp. SNU WT4 TaxID=2590015 RepID=UPI001125C53A|nr:hypothetical protein [Shewanella sp. SNU WT4]QDF66282.1 hypothetical protein FJQ87_05880 [Shewanella sp. SNU WT4]